MAFIRLTVIEPAPYGESDNRQAYINADEIVEITKARGSGIASSGVLMRDGRTLEVSEKPEAIIRKIAGVMTDD